MNVKSRGIESRRSDQASAGHVKAPRLRAHARAAHACTGS
jgi:hypothetical protein